MNREIKFRVWDGINMFYLEAFKDKSNHYLETGTDGFWVYTSDTGTKITSTQDGGTLMQYTGLKDKNGKEIYEGDIIPSLNSKKTDVVAFKNGTFTWFNEPLGWDLFIHEQPEELNTETWAEVIGNIYENPELLK